MSLVLSLKNLFPATASNEWLMTQYRLRQESKFLEQLYNNCANDLYHFLLSQSDVDTAKDVAQRTWVKVIDNRNQYQHSGRFVGWLFTIGRNQLMDELRKQKRLQPLLEQEDVAAAISVTETKVDKQFDQALQSLPFLQREAFMLRQEGFGLQEISDITSSPVEAIKSRIRYAKAHLRKILGAYHD